MDKRRNYILIGAGIILVILILLTVVLGSQSRQIKENLQTETGQSLLQDSTQTGTYEQLPPPTSQSTPEEVAEGFYNWYVSHPDPLGSGDYEKSLYITDEYKESMTGFVVRGDHLSGEPVLTCVGITPPKDIIAQPTVYEGSEMSYVILQRNVEGARPLYKVILKNVQELWLVDDIRCVF
ncbi:hypothetical protein A3C98_02735 [Candidatus Roizmanbacteria bacterium RIFCSPHIGHO2_02_FULL_37_15]|uniref:DUF3828 domain-containing protein n=1 Tax=Candidatus Roizmanbacteria bacterium RIFCSPLOWO2_01_FULL_37_16 TaxID=1802058 RepID=A0A1F7IM09_9BACT|nr:MAG: hypothetical protein A2859_05710 [Candidatus Roizmanbacteria bacterium RIFCSPHIGHO2_01_FULL_37_16b]OGK22804.1 MAG: hypothetical protein A3C98_02735 [Candidatus Roizmanbacteria bacterium RIFCSPHIGHO2_02_FULL_37_15]OGK33960.1 MAG: hypothetical protein A3F57_06070 [Candidatus Roizmanbacteria bacterium RIFCSPHIGHO2_12_FULL_36_11]OGK44416.1 MAG: hypothetical protein A3B40_02685 [Candidatus Roizmanbacteria bacterium RIFCSPLOWO2_01_FULL_37_16]OGK57507.1 MAG: hypothetical protein A3I50_03825 [C